MPRLTPKLASLEVKIESIDKLYPHKDKCCHFMGHSLTVLPAPKKDGEYPGGYFDELFPMKKGKKYRITVEEL